MKTVACVFAYLLVLSAGAHAATAAWQPSKAIELIAASAAGGGTDITARTLQKIIQDQRLLDVAAAVVNKPGGGGNIALAYLKQHSGDAHYVDVASALLITNQIEGKSAFSYRDFTPLALLASEYVAFAVNANSPLKSAQDLLARLATDPGGVSVAVGTGVGGANHAAAVLVARAAGADPKKLKTVVFKSSSESVTALLGGHIDIVVASASVVASFAQAGQLRLLAIAAPRRSQGALAAVPTWKELGHNIVVDNFRVLLGPPAMNAAQTAYWEGLLAKILRSDEWKRQVEANLWEGGYLTAAETRAHLDAQYEVFKRVLADLALTK